MSSVDGVSLILIALAIDVPEVFSSEASVTLLRNYSDPPNMRCGGCKAAGIDREIWFYGEGENIGARLVRWLLRRATAFARLRIVIRIGRRISPKRIPIRKTSYTYGSKNGELFVEPDAEISLRLRQQIGLWPGERVHDVPIYSGLLEDICDLFPRIFAVSGALILSSTGWYSRGSSTQDLGSYDFEKRDLGTLRSTYFERWFKIAAICYLIRVASLTFFSGYTWI